MQPLFEPVEFNGRVPGWRKVPAWAVYVYGAHQSVAVVNSSAFQAPCQDAAAEVDNVDTVDMRSAGKQAAAITDGAVDDHGFTLDASNLGHLRLSLI